MGKDHYNSLQHLQSLCDDGNFEDFKKYCDTLELKRRQEIVQKKLQDGQTFLIAACKKGHFELVKYLIDECNADIEQTMKSNISMNNIVNELQFADIGHKMVDSVDLDLMHNLSNVASVKFDGEQVEGVPPLWCASAAGHIEVVKLLVSRNAQVNRTTITNSTALRAACFDGHLSGADIEIPNRHGHTCLMISCYRGHATIVNFLLEHGARVNRQSAKGNTALHDCAESGNLEGLKLLLAHNAIMKEDEYGMTPIMAGANSGYKTIVEYLESNYSNKIPIEEIAMSYELLGANFLDRQSSPLEAKETWKTALKHYAKSKLKGKPTIHGLSIADFIPKDGEMEWVDADGDSESRQHNHCEPMETNTEIHEKGDSTKLMFLEEANLLPRLTIDFESSSRRSPDWRNYPIEGNERLTKSAKEALGNVTEFTTIDELNNLQEESDNLKLQTLLIRLRILGPDHPDTIYYIRYRGAIYADSGNIQRCLSLWMYALELQKIYLEPLCHVAQSAFLSFAELFSYILSENYVALPAVGLDPNLLIDCLELCVDSIDRGIEFSYYRWRNKQNWSYTSADKDASNLLKQTSLCLIFMAMISHHYCSGVNHLSPLFTEKMQFRFCTQVYRLVKLDPRLFQGQTLLHLACSKDTGQIGRFPICQFPNIQVVTLLLKADANPNVADALGTTPLEMLSIALRKQSREVYKDIMKLLVDHGAHIDIKHKSSSFKNFSSSSLFKFYTDNGINPVKYMTLGCWCQLSIREHNIEIPSHLTLANSVAKFLDLHA